MSVIWGTVSPLLCVTVVSRWLPTQWEGKGTGSYGLAKDHVLLLAYSWLLRAVWEWWHRAPHVPGGLGTASAAHMQQQTAPCAALHARRKLQSTRHPGETSSVLKG